MPVACLRLRPDYVRGARQFSTSSSPLGSGRSFTVRPLPNIEMKPRLEHPSEPGAEPLVPEPPKIVGPVVTVLEAFGRLYRFLTAPRGPDGKELPRVPARRTLHELTEQAEAAAIEREQQEAAPYDPQREWLRRRERRKR